MALSAARPTKANAQNNKPTFDGEPMARLSVDIPADLLAEFKAHAARNRTKIKDIVTRHLLAELGR